MRRQLNIESGCFYKQPAIIRWVSGVAAVITFGLYLRSLRTHSCPASYIVKVKQSAKTVAIHRLACVGNFFTSRFETADCNALIPTLAAIRESSGAERLVNGVSLQFFTSGVLLQRLM